MKSILLLLLICVFSSITFANEKNISDSLDTKRNSADYKSKALLENPYQTKPISLNADIRMSGGADFKSEEGITDAGFKVTNFRFDLRGDIHEQISFRIRARLSREAKNNLSDDINNNIDLFRVDYRLLKESDRYTVNLGKRTIALGGYEWNFDGIEKARTSWQGVRGTLTGGAFVYKQKKNIFELEITNENIKDQSEMPYGTAIAGYGNDFKYNAAPLAYSFCYTGDITNTISTISSVNVFNSAQDMTTIAMFFGFKTKVSKTITIMADYSRWSGGLDRIGKMTDFINKMNPGSMADGSDMAMGQATNTSYNNIWTRIEYLNTDRIKFILSGFVGNGIWNDAEYQGMDMSKGEYSYKTACFIPSVEYSVIPEKGFRAFIGYEYQMYNYSDAMEANSTNKFKSEQRINFGIISSLELFTIN